MTMAIAIIGLGCRFPGADGPEAFWALLRDGVDAVREVPADRWDLAAFYAPEAATPGKMNTRWGGFLDRVDGFEPRFFGISPREASAMDPQQRLVLEVAHEALEDAAVPTQPLAGRPVGVYLGVSSADYAQLAMGDAAEVTPYSNSGAAASVIANRLSYQWDLRGPSMVVDTACSASLVAVHLACQALESGECELAIAGGVNVILSPAIAVGFSQAQATSPDGRCKAFDADANGMVRGEGAGVVILKRLADAERDGDVIRAVIRGGAVNQDGRTNGLTAPSRFGQEALLRTAYGQAGIAPGEVAYVEAHGTGTMLGDPIEAAALGAVLGVGRPADAPCRIGSVKSNLGHLEAAAGIAGLIKTVLALEARVLPPSLHFQRPNPHIPFSALGLAVQDRLGPWPGGRLLAGVSAFGFGGTNAHLILEGRPRSAQPVEAAELPRLLALSARSPEALTALAARTRARLLADPGASLTTLCRTAALRRTDLAVRRGLAFSTRTELLDALEDLAAGAGPVPQRAPQRPPRLVFVFPGMGAQRPGMGQTLLSEPVFYDAIVRCDEAMRPYQSWSLLAELQASPEASRAHLGDVAQPLIFALQVGLTALLASWGLRPDAVVGASLGEIAAAYVAGALTLEDAAQVVCRRAQIMMTLAGHGTMAMVALPLEAAQRLVAAHPGRAWVAASNSPTATLLSGEQDALEAILAEVTAQEGFGRLIPGAQVGSHSPMVASLEPVLMKELANLAPRSTTLPLWSTVTGRLQDGAELGADYWRRNMREPVLVTAAVTGLAEEAACVFIELSPHPGLAPAIAETLSAAGLKGQALGALRRERPENLALRDTLAAAWAAGLTLDWAELLPAGNGCVPLPSTSWQHERFWLEATVPRAVPHAAMRPVAAAAPETSAIAPAPERSLDRAALLAAPPAVRHALLLEGLRAHVARVLGLAPARLDVEEPLTSLGIGSLMGMELNNRIQAELGVKLPIARLLQGPSLAELAHEVLARLDEPVDTAAHGPVARPRPGHTAPLSPMQQRLWILAQLTPDSAAYHIPTAVRLIGALDVGRLAAGLQAIISRHEALRTSFRLVDGDILQVIAPQQASALPIVDLSGLPPDEQEEEAAAMIRDEADHPFDLERGPLLRTTLLRLAPDTHVLVVTLHHLIADGWSLGVLLGELGACYRDGARALPPLTLQYADYAVWQAESAEESRLAPQLAYWRDQLAGAPAALDLPSDWPRPAVDSHRGGIQSVLLDPVLVAGIEGLARVAGATVFMTVLAAYSVFLGRLSGQDDLVVGTPVSGRHQAGLEGLIGFFLNTLPLRADLSGAPSFKELLQRMRATTMAAFANQEVPFERLIEVLQPARSPGRSPLFQVVLAHHAPIKAPRLDGLTLELVEVDGGTAKYDLTAALLETNEGLRLAFEYHADLWDGDTIARWLSRFQTLMASAVASPDTAIADLDWLPAREAAELATWRSGPSLPVGAGDLVARIAYQVAARPEAVAVADADGMLTYAELWAGAGAIAAALQAAGAPLDAPIAVLLPRGGAMVCAWLGVLRLGAAYLPLDPGAPTARVAGMLEDAGCRWRVATSALAEGQPFAGQSLLLDDAPPTAGDVSQFSRLSDFSEASRISGVSDFSDVPGELAYVLFTSGSTGRPKGVAVSRAALGQLVDWHLAAYGLTPDDRCSQVANAGFDAAGWEVWPTLCAGAALHVAPEGGDLQVWLADQSISIGFVPTPVLEVLLTRPWPAHTCLRAVLTGGDRLRLRPPADLPFQLYNHYGPTEATVVATAGAVSAAGADAPDIGRPIAGTTAWVLDALGRECPVGVPGELHLGGLSLAEGYWRRPDLTAETFVVGQTSAGRLYRTGDRVAWRPDGALTYLGRVDHQIKIRGVRVEPGEVAAVLQACAGVTEALVVGDADAPGGARLLAYVTGAVDTESLWSALRAQLPGSMVPAAIIPLDTFPLTANGKIDRRALPVPGVVTGGGYEAPVGAVEAAIAEAWAELLGLPRVGRHDDFFALGGHSILAMRLVGRLQTALGVSLPLDALFTASTPALLAARVESLRGQDAEAWPVLAPDPAGAHMPFALTDVQQAYWVGRDASLAGGRVAAHAYAELEAVALDPERLTLALNRLIARHPMMRARVTAHGEQVVSAEVPWYEPVETNLVTCDEATRLAALASTRDALSHQILPADHWPLFELRLSTLPGGVARLHLSLDALLADALSLGLLAQELAALYGDPDVTLPPLSLQFRDYVRGVAALQDSPAFVRSRAYWSERLATLPAAPALPLATLPEGACRFERRSDTLDAARWAAFKRRAGAHGLTPTSALLAAFSAVLARFSRQAHFSLNLTLFDRLPLHPDVERLVGDFTALTLLEVDARGAASFSALAAGIQGRLWQDLAHRHAGGVWVLRELSRARGPEAATMPVVFTSVLDQDLGVVLESGPWRLIESLTQTPQVWLDHQVSESHGALATNWDAREGRFPAGLLDAMFVAYTALLRQLADDDVAWASMPDVLPAHDAALQAAANDTCGPLPAGLLQDAFLARVASHPAAPAVFAADRTLSYAELHARACEIAVSLRDHGAEPGRLVAIVMEKGWEQVAAVLGVLYAGAAYVPVDTALPTARRAAMLAQAEVRLAVTQARLAGTLEWPEGLTLIGVSDAEPTEAVANAPTGVPSDLAYVIFTSGSTGQPKGVMIDHQAALNTIVDVNERFAATPEDRVLALSSLSFDLSVYDVFGPLSVGAAIVMPPPGTERDPACWLALMTQHGVTLWNSVPALLKMLVTYAGGRSEAAPAFASLRLAMLSGDWIPTDLPAAARAIAPGLPMVSLGGATEAAIWSISQPIHDVPPDWVSIPYGRPMRNQRFYVLDDALQPCPLHVPGHLYIAGSGVALGYWRDPGRTAESFFTHPLSGERLYRTGDLGAWRADGTLAFLGREDQQVKIQGHRIELGEVETALLRQDGVLAAAAVAVGPLRGEKHLIAFAVAQAGQAVTGEELQTRLRTILPTAMVPVAIVMSESLPLSDNGKVDRVRLAALAPGAAVAQGPDDDALVARVTALVAEVMGRESLDPRADLLAQGLNSIDMVRLANRLETEHGFRPELGDLFGLRTIVDLARYYAGHVPSAPSARPALLLDPEAREAFKLARAGRPAYAEDATSIALPALPVDAALEATYRGRASARAFADFPVGMAAFGRWLEALRAIAVDGRPKWRYASAGGLYPVEALILVKPGGVDGLAAGIYAYDAERHSLTVLSPTAVLPVEAHFFLNRALDAQSRFTVFLVGRMAAITPIYGEAALGFCQLEAGMMTQQLMLGASDTRLALCPVGQVDEKLVSAALGLGADDTLIHVLLGGVAEAIADESWEELTI